MNMNKEEVEELITRSLEATLFEYTKEYFISDEEIELLKKILLSEVRSRLNEL